MGKHGYVWMVELSLILLSSLAYAPSLTWLQMLSYCFYGKNFNFL